MASTRESLRPWGRGRSSWETDAAHWESLDESEDDECPELDDDDDMCSLADSSEDGEQEAEDEDNWTPERNGEEFIAIMLTLLLQSDFGANWFCILCCYAARARAQGLIHKYGKRPGLQSSKYH